MLKGIVKSISVYYEKYELIHGSGHNMLKPVPGISEAIATTSSEDVEKYRGGLRTSGYIVELDDINVSPAKQQ